MQKIAVDTYNFPRMRKEGFVYVDKTAILHRLACGDFGKLFFLARPRRFGKSLAVSTLRALFEGRRDLFTGLAIEPIWDWSKSWPVIHLDMGSTQTDSVEEFKVRLVELLHNESTRNGVEISASNDPTILFARLIDALSKKAEDGQVVILIDEYDKPIIGHLGDSKANQFRDTLKSFYSVVKTYEDRLRFAFLTGVSKFAKVSIFSDLNNLIDKSLSVDTATLFGYTHEEVKNCFSQSIHDLALAMGISDDEAFAKIVYWYDGYRFEENAPLVINPVSLSLCITEQKFQDYWTQTAIPTFLIEAIKKKPINFSDIEVDIDDLSYYEPTDPNTTALLFQTGYLTIKSVEKFSENQYYHLGLPNHEVERSFMRNLSVAYANIEQTRSKSLMAAIERSLYTNDMDRFVEAL